MTTEHKEKQIAWPSDYIGRYFEEVYERKVKLIQENKVTSDPYASVFAEWRGKTIWPSRTWFMIWNQLHKYGTPKSYDWKDDSVQHKAKQEAKHLVYWLGLQILQEYGVNDKVGMFLVSSFGAGWYQLLKSDWQAYSKMLEDFLQRLAEYHEFMDKWTYHKQTGKLLDEAKNGARSEYVGFAELEISADDIIEQCKECASDERGTLDIETDTDDDDADQDKDMQDADEDGPNKKQAMETPESKQAQELRVQARQLIEQARVLEKRQSEQRKHDRRFENGRTWVSMGSTGNGDTVSTLSIA